MTAINLVEAVNQALRHELSNNDDVVVLGEDIGRNGGVFRATDQLQQQFGERRVIDTPLAESLICGMAIGLAAQGIKPVAEIQFMGFIYAAFDQFICHASRLRNRTRGRLSCPMVLRAPYGGGIHAPEHHSESTEAIFAHVPGIRVVIPSSPGRAYGLLLAAIRDPDPVVFLEPKRIYRLQSEDVTDDGKALPLDACFTLKQGRDVTIISWGAMLYECQQAIEQLSNRGVDVELIDLATIKPIDETSILQSVEKTGRCVIVQEAAKTCSVASEIAALIAEKGLLSLLAPIQRVTGFDTVMPLFKLEQHYMPSVERVIEAVDKVMEF
ncbi:Pyruvate dehydrogenase E1 component subunit beta [Sinobacterium norvegicum]|uniref:Pyruvate dehydrogenase E1 component subunit beta n=1 Tax=Sinobacterium norvegicum TaxID=1641715 RepID=A0ABM9ADL8_9GAMM|nr:alpha-ketoacid dehydrogenase subunit beta [Sinobacterium norvegicum]CAH0991293.1 Pyruvate dehydrogenase E1 component subunit beta [Sinobacterium norvegicum]